MMGRGGGMKLNGGMKPRMLGRGRGMKPNGGMKLNAGKGKGNETEWGNETECWEGEGE